ncbi:Uncharacterised protein [uncultured archaeon]|nr:Uncharacterised protein [uncultured archaeon]
MKAYQEDWSQESMPLQKSKEPKGEEISAAVCPVCSKKVRTIGGRMSAHNCVPTDKK